MHHGLKIAVGGGAAALLAVIAHGPLGMGAHFVAGLQRQADTAIAEAGVLSDLRIRFPTSPLSRTAIISGSAPEAERSLAIAAVSGIKGVHTVRFQGRSDTAERQAGASALAAGAIETCQSAIDQAVAGRTLSFRSGSAYLSPQSNRIIRDVAGVLRQCPGLQVEIGGHGNATGGAAINQSMSEERAKRVRDALVIRGVPPDVLSVKSYGASKPANAAEAKDPANRRVVFTVRNGGA